VLALLPEYAGLVDPVAELRAACVRAVAWLGEAGPVTVVAEPQGARVAGALLDAAGASTDADAAAPAAYLVVANGTARRTEKAPGFLDERAAGFDARLGAALRAPDPAALDRLDLALADELLVGFPSGFRMLGRVVETAGPAVVDYDDDPFGVQYWVMRWQCES
jgi:hypothetical protein